MASSPASTVWAGDVEHATVRFYGDLADLARGLDRDATVTVPLGTSRSVKDVLEAVGVPHTEVGLLIVGDGPVGFDHLVSAGERIAAYPPSPMLEVPGLLRTTEPAARFVLDVHLGTLARNLRLLGFDSWYRTDADDPLLAEVAVAGSRVLLTRDRGLLMRREIVHGHCVRSQDPFTQTVEVARRFGLGPRLRPFSRCLACNGELVDVDRGSVLAEVPPLARDAERFSRCTACDRVYWPGTHHQHLAGLVASVRRSLADDLGGGT
ncbi:MAG: Mut7-C ubiquitin/RNAse domain-containing protein [Actinobacteria bacterium]|nr:Mut7-C ubiquitin/RNAse domain-containing protein [Actinomycetota bacterium]